MVVGDVELAYRLSSSSNLLERLDDVAHQYQMKGMNLLFRHLRRFLLLHRHGSIQAVLLCFRGGRMILCGEFALFFRIIW